MIILLVIIGLSLVILIHEVGHFVFAKLAGIRVLEFGIGFPPRIWKKKCGDTLISINALPFGGFVRLYGEDGIENGAERETDRLTAAVEMIEEERIAVQAAGIVEIAEREEIKGVAAAPVRSRSFAGASFPRKAGTLVAGVAMNVVFGWLLLIAVFLIGTPHHLMIVEASPGSPAEQAGLAQGDIIVRAESRGAVLTDPIPTESFIAFVKSAGAEPITLDVRSGSEVKTVTLAPRANPPEGEGALGVGLSEIGVPSRPFFEAIGWATRATAETLAAVAQGLWHLAARVFTAPEILRSVSGPVGIVSLAVEAGSLGLLYILQILALISLNLAVLNLIPFPALDGGRILLAIIERVFGRALPRRFQVMVNAVGFVALILLMVIVTVQDIGKL